VESQRGSVGPAPIWGQPAILTGEERTLAIHLGLDLAQSVDFTAICTTEVRERLRVAEGALAALTRHTETYYRVQDLRRLPHGVSYADQARFVVAYLANIYEQQRTQAIPAAQCALFIDATGLGKPVVDLIEERLLADPRTHAVWMYPLRFRQGEQYDRGNGVIGKTHLISSLQALLAADRLDLPAAHPLLDVLKREIADYRIKIDASTGVESLGGVGSHDDLVTALALSVVDDPLMDRIEVGPVIWGP
jgi:hypothetical protein